MELKVLMKVGLFLFLMGFAATNTVDGRSFDPSSLIAEAFTEGEYYVKSKTEACCDTCICTKSMPPQCECLDFGTTCHSACKLCICTLSEPPQCRCHDSNSFCYDKCTPGSSPS